jgi:anti-sigma factor RsiW
MTTCRDLDPFVADFVAGELAPGPRASFATHLRACAACRRYVARYRATIRAVKAAFADDAAPRAITVRRARRLGAS